jgi:type IV pilus assembly protein PilY1
MMTFNKVRFGQTALYTLFLLGSLLSKQATSQALTSANFALTPPLITESSPPNVMIVMSDDHELYKKAYSDFTDISLPSDGTIESSYDDSITYTGYFDSNFCYVYDSTDTRFEPAANISALIASTGHSCAAVDGDWSGNFLNWASMTRMDMVRHVLFGGYRIVDSVTVGVTPGVTELERAFLPEDTHSFVKVFTGATQNYTPWTLSSISLCNTTYGATTNAPLIRVGNGAWPLWASSEVVQCHYRNESNSGLGNQPTDTDRPGTFDYSAQVQVCVVGMDSTADRCKAYSNSSGEITYKPIGLLQRYGDSSTINFGLMTGSYNKKIQGGVLRKDIMPLTGNTTASLNEVDLTNGKFINQGATDAGIIHTISSMRIISWDYGSNVYSDCSTYGISKSTFMSSASANRQCRNWGSPLSEIYLEALRYFTGDDIPSAPTAGTGTPTATFNTSDATLLPSIPQLNWTDPLTSANSCASCSIIVLSTGLNTFDADELGTVTDLWNTAGSTRFSSTSFDALLDTLGTIEGITSGSYLVGSNGTINDGACTAKTVSNLSSVRGLCPEVGSMEGGFGIAGLAYHSLTKDLRSDFSGLQNVNTYSVSLADNLPSYTFTINGKKVSMVPTCQAHTTGSTKLDGAGWTPCSFVDARIESQTATSGRMYIAWEDSMWGNDFDMDAVARIEWCIGTDTTGCPGEAPNHNYGIGYAYTDFTWKTTGLTADSIQIRVSGPLAAAGNALKMGFSISGVENVGTTSVITNTPSAALTTAPTTSGTQYIARSTQGNGEQYFLLLPGGNSIKRLVSNSGNAIIYHAPLVYTASSTTTTGLLLKNPLWYTAKYGSFNDIDKDGTPKYLGSTSDNREWDSRNLNGAETPDGIPDNYFPITNPSKLSDNLTQVFEIISSRISSGTAAAVVANSSSGLGAVYQAYYHPQYKDSSGKTIAWGGVLHSMFIDSAGRFREDNGVKGTLEDPNTDYVVGFIYDKTVSPNRTRFQRYTQTGSGSTATITPYGARADLQDFHSAWNARDVLADISDSNLLLQRPLSLTTGKFSETAESKRYIFTYTDNSSTGTPGVIDVGEVTDFTDTNFDATNGTNRYRYLGLSTDSDAIKLARYIRGVDQTGWRPRLIDIPGDGSTSDKRWILGDIVHSSPLSVNPPSQRYDLANGDETYEVFKRKYERRRQVIYTGGNDGMLHAFNGGSWDPVTKSFQTREWNPITKAYDSGPAHKLGAEMWAYVPQNLLPHLQWLKEKSYPHVYFVDSPPQAFDVNIFPSDATHPSGWGTILVVGMRLGGGNFPLDLDGNGTKETTMGSALIIMDITDPERPPTLLAELRTPDMGFTTSLPTVVKARVPSASGSYTSPTNNKWLLVYGSGPDTLTTAVSAAQDAKLFAYDLVGRTNVSIHTNAQVPAADPSGFLGDFTAVDWNNDFIDDVIYVGTIEGNEVTPTGRLKRIVLAPTNTHDGLANGTATMSDVFNMQQPLSSPIKVQRAVTKNERWLLFGTGRLFTKVDNRSTTQQSYYGLKEPSSYDTSSLALSQLVDSTTIVVKTDGTIIESDMTTIVNRFTANLLTYPKLTTFMDSRPGWVNRLGYNGGTNPSERVFNSSLIKGSSVIFTTYTPPIDQCAVEGTGRLYGVNFRTGTAEAFGLLGESSGVFVKGVSLGEGAPSAPVLVSTPGKEPGPGGTPGDAAIVTINSAGTGAGNPTYPPPSTGTRMSWEQLEIVF